jgi:hypothetical protein
MYDKNKKSACYFLGGVNEMEPRQPGNNKLPDFDQLNDRIIAEQPSEPHLIIKTNLDPQDSTENNPYYQGKDTSNPKAFKDYFEE